MSAQHFEISIKAPKEKVWNVMLAQETYKIWTAAFSAGSYYEGSWEKGAKIKFLGPDSSGGPDGGMSSEIADNRPYEFISIHHLGIIKDGVEDTESAEAKSWGEAFENYTFKEHDGVTQLSVDLTMGNGIPEFVEYMEKAWPIALAKLKELCE